MSKLTEKFIIEELEAENKNLRHMIIDQIEGMGDDPEIMAASRAEWAARAKAAEFRIEELEGMLPEDNRPCSTDRFLVAVVDEIDDHYDKLDAIKCWIEGAWDEAIKGTTLAELTGGKDD